MVPQQKMEQCPIIIIIIIISILITLIHHWTPNGRGAHAFMYDLWREYQPLALVLLGCCQSYNSFLTKQNVIIYNKC